MNLGATNYSFTYRTLLITGGTVSFGNTVMRRFLKSDTADIRIFSRDEEKQENMRKAYKLRDPNSVRHAMHDVEFVFHDVALKQVPAWEFYQLKAVKINAMGTSY